MSVRFSTVTLPSAQPERTVAFLTGALGLAVEARYGELVYLATGDTRLAVYPVAALVRYAGVPGFGAEGGVLLSLNFDSAAAVDAAVERALGAGAVLTRSAGPFDWGGHGACLRDPDGRLWELVHAPTRPPAA